VISTAADGAWKATDLAPGHYKVSVSASGYEPINADEEVVLGTVADLVYRLLVKGDGIEVTVRGERPPREVTRRTIEQREIGLDTMSFQEGLKHILRQDPDIIMIGEMRDSISFQAAMSAADTGHLVLSTLHTTNAAQSVTRILDFFRADEREQVRRQLAGTLQAVVCQRMVNTIAGSVTPAIEILINTGTVKKLIEENRLDKLGAAIETGTEDGMQNFNQALFQLVKDRKVSEKEALAKATNAQALEMNFKGIFLDEGRRILG